MKTLILLTLLSFSFSMKECDEIYKCLEDTTDRPVTNITHLELCEWTIHNKNGIDTIYMKRCPDGYVCDDLDDDDHLSRSINDNDSDDSDDDANEDLEFCFPATTRHIEGEVCSISSECLSQNCTNGTCQATPDGNVCKSHGDCGKHSYCDRKSNTCQRLLEAEVECNDNYQCGFGYVCGKLALNENRRCLQMMSQPNGQWVSDDDLCESREEENNLCADRITGVTNGVKPCDSDRDCSEQTVVLGRVIEKDEGECECSYAGNKYCELGTDSEQWKQYVTTFRDTVAKYKEGTIHVAVYREREWNVIPILAEAKLYTDVENYDAPKCAIEFLINSTSHLSSSSGYIKMSIIAVIAVIAMLF